MENNYLLKNLNDNQIEAAIYTEGPSIIIAGAGVGKTLVLTHKISYLIDVLKIPSQRILAVTFTNKAAKEMKNRTAQILNTNDNDKNQTKIFTYHGLCAQILKRESHNININNNFNIIDDTDKRQILRDIYKNDFNHKPEANELKIIINYISEWKNNYLTKDDIIFDYSQQEQWVLRARVYEKYKEYQQLNSCLDFDDLLLLVEKLFKQFDDIAKKWQEKFDYILIDEFQDTNNLQYEIISKLISKKQNITVVGDPDQTIYSWRGANINLILKFSEKFANVKTFILNQNYRSTEKILNTANSLIINNEERIEKKLFTNNNIGENIIVFHAENSMQEAEWIAKVIKNINLKENIKLNKIAILYRNNYLSKDLEQSLIHNNLNYRIIKGFKFFERKEIKDILAYLKVIVWNDNLSMIRLLNTVPKIGTKTIENILNQANENKLTISEYLLLFQHNLSKNQKNYLQPLINLIEKFQEKSKNVFFLNKIVSELLEESKYLEQLKNNFEDERIENIKQFLGQLLQYDNNNNENVKGQELLINFLQEISLYTDLDEESQSIEAVNLMTIHNAKGLEFDVVFISGINEGIFCKNIPTKNLTRNEKKVLEEERRLFYVAITRAKKFLYLSSFSGRSFVLNSNLFPSRFLQELDEKNLKFIFITNDYENFSWKNKNFNKRINVKKSISNLSLITNNWKINDMLTHSIFGQGVVTKIIGDKIEVKFHTEVNKIKIFNSEHPSIKKVS